MRRTLLFTAPLAASLGGCDGTTLDNYLNVTMAEVLLLHTPDLAEEYGVESGAGDLTAAEVYLLQAKGSDVVAEDADVKVSGAVVRLEMPDGTAVPLEEVDVGHYQVLSTDNADLYYEERGEYGLLASVDGINYAASARSYVNTRIDSPVDGTVIDPAEPLTIALGEARDATLLIAYDESGEEVYSTVPETSDEFMDLLSTGGQTEVEIPGKVFADGNYFFIGAAVTEVADWTSTSEDLSTSLSSFLSGSLDAVAVSTVPLQGLQGLFFAVDGSAFAGYGLDDLQMAQAYLYGAEVAFEGGIDAAPVSGAEAALSWGTGSVTLVEDEETEGLYAADDTTSDLEYLVGDTCTFALTTEEGTLEFGAVAPEAPEITDIAFGDYHEPGTHLTLTMPDTHDHYFVAVVDLEGEILYDTLPQGEDVEALLDGDVGAGPGEELRIGGDILTGDSLLYGIGLLGLKRFEAEEIPDTLNPDYSALYLGAGTLTAVSTGPLQGLQGLFFAVDDSALAEYGLEGTDMAGAWLYGAELSVEEGLEPVPISGGEATLSWATGSAALTESTETEGLYEADETTAALECAPGDTCTFSLVTGEDTLEFGAVAPEAPEIPGITLGDYHEPGTDLVLTLPETHDHYFVAVVDQNGELIYETLPEGEDAEALFAGDAGAAPGEDLVIGGDILTADSSVYGIGLLGLERFEGDDVPESLNADYSALYLGSGSFTAVTTVGAR